MVKGVNKLIVEVSNPKSEFFERAIFFVRPQMKDTPTNELNKSADSLLFAQFSQREPTKCRRKPRIALGVAAGFAAGALGAVIAAVLLGLLR